MKKISLIFAWIFIGFMTVMMSCKKDNRYPTLGQVQMYYLGDSRDYSAATNMTLYPDSNYLLLRGDEWNTVNYITIKSNIATGTYLVDYTSSDYIFIYKGYKKYTTQTNHASGTFTITKLDTSSRIATGTFSGTLKNVTDANDSLIVTQGILNIQVQK